jgi:hypothetical protein
MLIFLRFFAAMKKEARQSKITGTGDTGTERDSVVRI